MPLGPAPHQRWAAIFITDSKKASIGMALGIANYGSEHTHLGSKRSGMQRLGCFASRTSSTSLVPSLVHGSSGWWRLPAVQAVILQTANLSLLSRTNVLYLLAFTLKVWFFWLVVFMQASLHQSLTRATNLPCSHKSIHWLRCF